MTALVVVQRCAEALFPLVPSDVVQCAECHEGCWISKKSGDASRELATRLAGDGTVRVVCLSCQMANYPVLAMFVTPEAEEEYSQANPS